MNEINFIKYLQKTIPRNKGLVRGIGDDCAVINYTKDKYQLFASDMIIEGVHFTKGTDPFKIGWKAAAVNLSDIAAMGGVPKYVTVSIGAPAVKSKKILKGIIKGAGAICGKFGCVIAGGDTNSSPVTVVDVAIIGEVEKNKVVRRDTAKKGDSIFVTGVLGNGKLKHLSFMPRIKEARILVQKFKLNALMDISDGLCLDLARICEASRAGAVVYKDKLPVSQRAKSFNEAISYGEDFELLFTMPRVQGQKLLKYSRRAKNLKVTCIGEITHKKNGMLLVDGYGKTSKLQAKGYQHF